LHLYSYNVYKENKEKKARGQLFYKELKQTKHDMLPLVVLIKKISSVVK